jgi:hypothetical protein
LAAINIKEHECSPTSGKEKMNEKRKKFPKLRFVSIAVTSDRERRMGSAVRT